MDVTDLDFRVAFRLMQHINSVSRMAWPSVARLAAQLGKSRDRIFMASTKRLQAAAWVVKNWRRHQKAPNEYEFLDDRVNVCLDAMIRRLEEMDLNEDEVAEMQRQTVDEVAEMRVLRLQICQFLRLQIYHLNTLTRTT